LPDALRELAANAETIFNIQCTFDQQSATIPAIEAASSMHLYRIAQEAITNAVRHGAAKHVNIELCGTSDALVVRIVDDGAGIPNPTAGTDGDGMGLRIMRYRARMIGATIDMKRRAGGSGTEVTCLFTEHASPNGR
jgi:signal transduction histidine kinase